MEDGNFGNEIAEYFALLKGSTTGYSVGAHAVSNLPNGLGSKGVSNSRDRAAEVYGNSKVYQMTTITPETKTGSSASNLSAAYRFSDLSRYATVLGLLSITLVAAIVFVPNIVAGGFAMDDWIAIGQYPFHHGTGFWSQVTSSQVYPARAPMAVTGALEISALGTSSA